MFISFFFLQKAIKGHDAGLFQPNAVVSENLFYFIFFIFGLSNYL